MDAYTDSTRDWLDERFAEVDSDGVYRAHQPIYGFRAGHCEPEAGRYAITWGIVRALASLRFTTLVDIGGGEGYTAALARDLLGCTVTSCDLSAEACRRAKDIYGIDGEAVDIHHLPFSDGQFDVVLCSETLEHVPDIRGATMELLRVARKAVVITVPRESEEVVARNIRERVPHGHIHALRPDSFDFASPFVRRIVVRPLSHRLLGKVIRRTVGAPKALRKVLGARTVSALVGIDPLIAPRSSGYRNMLFVLLKDESSWTDTDARAPRPRAVIDYRVPLHRLPDGRRS